MEESKIETCSIRVYTFVLNVFMFLILHMEGSEIETCSIRVYTFVLNVSFLLLIPGCNMSVLCRVRLLFGLNVKSSLWMNTISFFMK